MVESFSRAEPSVSPWANDRLPMPKRQVHHGETNQV